MDYELLEKFYKTFDAHFEFDDVEQIVRQIVEKDILKWMDLMHLAQYAPCIVRLLARSVSGNSFGEFKEKVKTEVVLFSDYKDKFESLMKEAIDNL